MCGLAATRWWAQVYGLLALGYHSSVDADQLDRITACEGLAAEVEQVGMAGLLSDLSRHARETDAECLRQDFDDLFVVPGPKYVTPYESVYRDGSIDVSGRATSLVYGPSTRAVCAFYDRIGLKIEQDYSELPDYVGLEMACMEYLYVREADYLEAMDESSARAAADFRESFCWMHLAKWIPDLERRIREQAETAYYRTFAAATLAAVSKGIQTTG